MRAYDYREEYSDEIAFNMSFLNTNGFSNETISEDITSDTSNDKFLRYVLFIGLPIIGCIFVLFLLVVYWLLRNYEDARGEKKVRFSLSLSLPSRSRSHTITT